MAAARAMLDEIHPALPNCANDSNAYTLGSIVQHNVVITCLPTAQYGTNTAANVLTNLNRTFPSIRLCLMVGIGGGAPNQGDIRLGDVVVGTRVMQYDLGKITGGGQFQRTAVPRIPDPALGTAMSVLRSIHGLHRSQIPSILRERLDDYPEYRRPSLPDYLFRATYEHKYAAAGCDGCDRLELVQRKTRTSDAPTIHYGAIASGNQVMRNGTTRDAIARQLDVICFEMEAAGLMDILSCLPIRGICDYSDSHKSKEWQRYAAAVAAAYARELLGVLPVSQTHPKADCAEYSVTELDLIYDRRKRLLKSLKFSQDNARKTTIQRAHTKTCRWFLEHPDFQAWQDPERLAEHHGFLWLSGKPGAGKSTMMKFAYERVKTEACGRDAITASFFFNARGEHLEKSISGMYRSLLLQLLEGFSDLQTVLDDTETIPRGYRGCPPLGALKYLFRSAVSQLGQRSLTCFVDALDECDEQQVIDIVQYFEDLAEISTKSSAQLRICFSTRHYPYIDIRCGVRLTLEDQPGHGKDLANYVRDRLRIRDPILVADLQHQILKKAAGVFLWVALVVDILNREDRRGRLALRTRLAEIPSGLSELFKDILQRDNEKNVEELRLCILWILYAKRPLRPEEYYHALWSGLSVIGLADSEMPDATGPDARDCVNRCVVSSSKGIAEITRSEQPTVQFIHESIRDFLIKDKGLYELWPDLGLDWERASHERLKQCCSTYMDQDLVHTTVMELLPRSWPYTRTAILARYPFLEYANEHVLYHAETAADVVPQADFLSRFPFHNSIGVNNSLKPKQQQYSLDTGLLYILAEKGFSNLIRTRLKEDPRTEIVGGLHRYPLFAALRNDNGDAVAALLDCPSNAFNEADIAEWLNCSVYCPSSGRTPLSWVAEHGLTRIVRLLLKNVTEVNEVDWAGLTALARTTTGGQVAIARLLIENGAEVNTTDKFGETPLARASWEGQEAIARLLIENGADVNATNRFGETPLIRALLWQCQEAMARLLIENGADVNAADRLGRTPLFEASAYGHETLVRLLVENGADVNSDNNHFGTSLLRALRNGHKVVATLLIEYGAVVTEDTAALLADS